MARSTLVLMLVAALLLSSTMAQSPAPSPKKAVPSPSHSVSPSAKSPAASPTAGRSPHPSSPSGSSAAAPSSISASPSEAPAPAAHNGAVLNRIALTGSLPVIIFAAAFLL